MHPQSTEPTSGDLIATAKTERPVGDLFTVSGEHGRVSYDQFANRIELHDAYGDIEAMGKRWSDQVAEAADRDDDEVFALLAEHYRTELAPTAAPTNPDRRCHRCGATSGLKMLHRNPLTLADREWECYEDCTGGAR